VDDTNAHLNGVVRPDSVNLVGDGYGPTTDLANHGTTVAGIIAARPVDGSTVVGVAPQATILSLRVYQSEEPQGSNGVVMAGDDAIRLANAIQQAADLGAQISTVPLSLSVNEDDYSRDLLAQAVQYATDHGALVVASAGNRTTDRVTGSPVSETPHYPAAAPGALAVTAVEAVTLTSTPATLPGPHIHIAAPGDLVSSVVVGGADCYLDTSAGPQTSWSTAYVAGAAALVAAAYPDESPEQWAYRLMVTAQRPNPDQRDDNIGWGVVRPHDAIALVPSADLPGPNNPFRP
jgi:subtilisin family serine protease